MSRELAIAICAVTATALVLTAGTIAYLLRRLSRQLHSVQDIVDGKLRANVDAAFSSVAESLRSVQNGLAQMSSIATDVGSLQRLLFNVKQRGTWGEYQLDNILSSILIEGVQYKRNVHPNPANRQRVVEFAIILPGAEEGSSVYLPIDSKFPRESYERLQEAADRGDAKTLETASKELVRNIQLCAKDISASYIAPPHTTNFAIMFLPTEGLYMEVVRQSGLLDTLQRQYHIIVAGPGNMFAILNALQVGFRTLEIQRRTSELEHKVLTLAHDYKSFERDFAKVERQLDALVEANKEFANRRRLFQKTIHDITDS